MDVESEDFSAELEHTGDAGNGLPGKLDLHSLAQALKLEYRPTLDEISPPNEPVRGEFSKIIGFWGKQYKIIPIAISEHLLTVASSNPLNTSAIDALRMCYDRPIKIVVTPESEIIQAINKIRSRLMTDKSSSLESEEEHGDPDAISSSLKIDVTDSEDDDAPIIRYVNTLIFRATTQHASDIHIEPFEDCLKVRFRVDGVLHDVDEEDKMFQASILSRIKVMANLNIAEKRLPQDGRIGIRVAGQDVDIRISTVPTRYGERIVMRLLEKSSIVIDLETLGLSSKHSKIINKIIHKSHGIILVTGPTGSGKTTTLYACLSKINSADKNILTVEDPVEYELKGIGQMQVNPKIDFTFATGLRSILRQDPDVIMVGEIRDRDTVEIAIQASLTGHLVFSTLHTNDAAGAVTRLLDMGVEPFLISSSVIAIMAQRLVRQLCKHCRVSKQISDDECQELGLDPISVVSRDIFDAADGGCKHCQQTGYSGRTGIHEIMLIDDEIRGKIMQRADASQIRNACRGFVGLRHDGAKKVLAGITSVEEVLRVTQESNIIE
ncbi:MAG: type II secretion system ATPase GspE [Deltaproteobacteria bacterium]|nr:type II secretion system ATPase GspE [Deltaproteobacteria bacterium]